MASAAAPEPPALADPRPVGLFWRATGVASALLAGVGILLVAIGKADLAGGLLTFDVAHNVLHAALAALAVWLGFGDSSPALARRMAKAVGVGLLVLGLLGFLSADLLGLGRPVGLRLDPGENLVHLGLGAWGAYVGFRE